MGCDIHIHVEIKLNGKWEHWNHPQIHRWYRLFGKLAGVRDQDETPIAEPRGLPEDATITTKFDSNYLGVDGHSHSWLSADEIENQLYPWFDSLRKEEHLPQHDINYWPENYFGYLCGNGWDKANMQELGIEDFRFIFWFDC